MSLVIANRSTIQIDLYGTVYNLKKPTVGEIEEMQDQTDKVSTNKEKSVLMRKLLSGLGLPEEVSKAMELDHFLQVVEEVMGTKKK